jgi:hypothetical protein
MEVVGSVSGFQTGRSVSCFQLQFSRVPPLGPTRGKEGRRGRGHVGDARRPLFAPTKTHFGCTKITFGNPFLRRMTALLRSCTNV